MRRAWAKYLTVTEAAAELGVTRQRVLALIRDGELQSYGVGASGRWPKAPALHLILREAVLRYAARGIVVAGRAGR